MSDDRMADDVYQPDNEEQADAAPLDLEDALDERDYDDVLDEGYSPPERLLGADRTGITAAEQREGETLDERLAQELPDVGAGEPQDIGDLAGGAGEPVDQEVGDARSGRLVAPGEGAHEDTGDGLFASDVGTDAGAASAEEAAVHVVPEDEEDF
ncbi:MAG TPA: DUF5709 domain-containing protein [Actinocrinis sp.]|nr:DUF5709 domain-containing protein [Actinocrinis sp.]